MQSWQPGEFTALTAPKYVAPEMIHKLCSEESADRHSCVTMGNSEFIYCTRKCEADALHSSCKSLECKQETASQRKSRSFCESASSVSVILLFATVSDQWTAGNDEFSSDFCRNDVRKWHLCWLLSLCGWTALSGLVNHTMWYFSWSVQIASRTHLSYLMGTWAGRFPPSKPAGAEADRSI